MFKEKIHCCRNIFTLGYSSYQDSNTNTFFTRLLWILSNTFFLTAYSRTISIAGYNFGKVTLAYFHALLVSLCGFDLPGLPGIPVYHIPSIYRMSVKEIEPAIYTIFICYGWFSQKPKAERTTRN